ncbi:MAG TPA: efflux RND transporter periplasmic adaptor subunit, partial [Planctomycetota bacterium]|nr:efflux RND transporter periplasmic adaptor subunit [Planctomycetota bacterium]
TVIARAAQPGETVQPGARLVTIANLARERIEADVDEYDAGRVTLGAEVTVAAEGHPGKTWRGRVEEIPDAVVGRRLRPQDPAAPADTRVLVVKVALLEPAPLKLGQRVEVAIAPPAAATKP